MKQERLDFAIEWGPKLEGKEHLIVHTDETSVRVGRIYIVQTCGVQGLLSHVLARCNVP